VTDLPSKIDPEIAAETLALHLAAFFERGRPNREAGWERIAVDALHTVVRIPAVRADGRVDSYLVLVGGEYYDMWPPQVAFVEPVEGEYREAVQGSPWWPVQNNAPGFQFGLHEKYRYPDGTERQLICFSHSLDYYLSNHSPTEDQRWRQGRHTVSATLSRIRDVLTAPNYKGPGNGQYP
jgi:hypothetical protein